MDTKVLLRRDGETVSELGVYLGRRGTKLRVRDSGGVEVEVAKATDGARDTIVTVGTVAHLLWVAPDQIELALSERPELLFKQLLRESPRGARAHDLRGKLRNERWSDRLDEAWERAKGAFVDDPTVVLPDSTDGVYTYSGSDIPDFAHLFPSGSLAAAGPEPEVADAETGAEASVPAAPAPEPVGSPPGATAVATDATSPPIADKAGSPRPAPTRQKASKAARSSADRDPVAAFLESLGDPALADISRIIERPLRAGRAFQRMSTADQKSLVNALPERARRLITLVAGPGKAGLLDAEAGELQPVELRDLLEVAVRELAQATKPGALTSSFIDLLQRAWGAGAVSTNLLLRVCSVTSRSDQAATAEVLDLVAERLRSTAPDDLKGWDLDLLARAMETTTFPRSGGRTAVLAALYAVDPVESAKARWWGRTDLGSLAEAARGGLARALEDEDISANVAAPFVREYVKGVATRSGMATVWSLPTPLARHVTGEDFAQLIASLAANDSLVAAWRDAAVGASEQARRARELEEAQANAERADAAREAAEARAARLDADLARTVDQLNQARAQGVASTEQRDRQSKIDAVRALALLAAQVLQSEDARSDEALVRTVQHTCAREGLTAVGEVGAAVQFDPTLHDSLGRAISEGSTVSVVRAGYTWVSGGEELVLLKPQVVIQGD